MTKTTDRERLIRARHKAASDSRGLYCLGCFWPGSEFYTEMRFHRQHVEDVVRREVSR